MMAITLNHTEVAYLRKKLGLSGRELCDLMGIKSFHDIYNYEADPARVKSAKPMSATHCALLVLIVEYYHNYRRLPQLEYLKSANLAYCARDMADGIAWSGGKNWVEHPSARELRAAYYKDKSSED
ncbi:MAG: hypothetical protein ACON5P_05390 [Candidatus Puniceispirillaceae bacterium]